MEHVETDYVWRVIYIYVWIDLHFHCCASNNGMLTSALTLFDTQQWKVMTSACHCLTHNNGKCRRHHFPLLCVKQCNADVSTFHCVSLHTETHFIPDPHIEHVETVLCVESD